MTMRPLVIIGAGRSGTNMLRDTLTAIPGWATWPCDEINLIWRHGNTNWPDDAIPPAAAGAARPYVRRAFDRIQRATTASVIVEKTCANSLRVPYVDSIIPEARYLYLVRDGRDVTLSAMRRWTAGIEPAYLLRKLRFAPPGDIPHYALRFLENRWHQMRSTSRRQALWGPRFPGMNSYAAAHELVELCARQWAECVLASDAAFSVMPQEKMFAIRYEEFVSDPGQILERLGQWYGEDVGSRVPRSALATIRDRGGSWRQSRDLFTDTALDVMAPVLKVHGYEPSS
ncbi:MAG: sulfotransferase [Rhodobiaceae bacterium]|nr:sulfotransferase [Rhodobiaceae bacterium]MCC0055198.1 sulfotransferase [Rhodobiaceae bacterium]